ncbi:MAG TPA: PHB depolymerase family esterase [Mycobacteriales bacterium]|nr:PHB depolymerase family esterase [Mycobacteriales bacterium]
MNTLMYSKRLGCLIAALVVCMLIASPAVGRAADAMKPVTGSAAQYTYSSLTGPVHFRVFTPSGYRKGHPVPLVVVTHGCNTNAEQMEASSAYDAVAEANDFVVTYPDDDDAVHPVVECWNWYLPTDWQRGEGDLATIAGMVHATMAMRSIDASRVYEIGMSSGALITSDLGAAYPRLFAAIGIMAGGPYGLAVCVAGADDSSSSASGALKEEGTQSRVMPFIVLNGDKDNVVSPGCDDQAVQQWLRTDNLVLSGGQSSPLRLSPARDTVERVRHGLSYNLLRYTAPNGCVIGEHYVIHGMGHFWSGGTSDPTYAQFTDPKGPSAAEASWTFFSHFSQSRSVVKCRAAS